MIKQMTAATAALALAACATYGDDMAMSSDDNVAEVVMMSDSHETLEQLVVTAGLGDTLMGAGPFTVFAPTDAAFDRVPAAQRTALMQPANREMLRGVLTYHVVAGNVSSSDLIGMINDNGGSATVTTVQGTPITASLENGNVKLTDATGGVAYVNAADLNGSNGVVHSINGVLMPRN